jgi:hypothetical protein
MNKMNKCLLAGGFLLVSAAPATAQNSHQQHMQSILNELSSLKQTGPFRNWNLEDDVRIWSHQNFRDIPEADLAKFDREIARERQLRGQQARQKQDSRDLEERRAQNQGRNGINQGSRDFPLSMPAQPAPPKWP